MTSRVTGELAARVRQAALDALPASFDPDLADFYRLIRDYPERAGKALRGQLVVLSSRAHAGDDSHDDSRDEAALAVAAALELFQAWALIHDDIEDGSEQRRGSPALHRLTGVPIALNVGDALHAHMWRYLLSRPLPSGVLGEFGAMVMRTTEGQHLDLSFVEQGRFDVSEAEYLRMVELKTAHYTVLAPLRLGALCAGVTPSRAIAAAAIDLGVAFQVRDDVLNLTGESEAYGKEPYGDIYEGKRTLITAHLLSSLAGEERARVVKVLAARREEKSPEEVAHVLELARSCGSLDRAQALAQERGTRGLRALESAFADLPGRQAVGELFELLAGLATRAL